MGPHVECHGCDETRGRGLTTLQGHPKPGAVTVLATLEFLTGAIFLLGGTALLTFAGGGSTILYAFGTAHFPIGVSFLVLGILSIFSTSRWVWTLGLAVAVISIVDDLVAFALVPLPFEGMVGTAVVLLTALVGMYYLTRKDVRAFFVK